MRNLAEELFTISSRLEQGVVSIFITDKEKRWIVYEAVREIESEDDALMWVETYRRYFLRDGNIFKILTPNNTSNMERYISKIENRKYIFNHQQNRLIKLQPVK